MFFPFDNTYSRLPAPFFEKVDPTPVSSPKLIAFNASLASDLGLSGDFEENEDTLLDIFSGNHLPDGATPIAMAYSGHQFGGFSPQLGDGRAILLGEVTGSDGVRRDIQLKGAGPTPFSRRGDGRSALGPVLREYLVSEAMAALGIPTTRALAAVVSGDKVFRETAEPGGVFTRVGQSHLRIGTVQYFAAHQDFENLKVLVQYTLDRHYPDKKDASNPALALLEAVMVRQAELVSKWMGVGFIHGVMNTDNMSLSGETIDYGPCAFMDHFDPARKFSYIDRGGRYAFANQPSMAHWNLTRLGEALLPMMADTETEAVNLATNVLEKFPSIFEANYIETFCRKIGIPEGRADSWSLAESLLNLMEGQKVDFTLCFRRLREVFEEREAFIDLFENTSSVTEWLERWTKYLAENWISDEQASRLMRENNPVFIPRNHRIEEVIKAGKQGEFAPFHRLHEVLQNPFQEQPEFKEYESAPSPKEVVPATFCGT